MRFDGVPTIPRILSNRTSQFSKFQTGACAHATSTNRERICLEAHLCVPFAAIMDLLSSRQFVFFSLLRSFKVLKGVTSSGRTMRPLYRDIAIARSNRAPRSRDPRETVRTVSFRSHDLSSRSEVSRVRFDQERDRSYMERRAYRIN